MISWHAPLHGRDVPATDIAIPESTSASASAMRKSSDSIESVRCRTASPAVRANASARPSTASPRSRCARSQSSIADRLLIASPMPPRTMAGGALRT